MKPLLPRHRLFAYGTLQLPERLQGLIGRVPPMLPAELLDYRCGLVMRADFPGIVPCSGERTSGMLLSGIQAKELQTLDIYEGELYHRIRIYAHTRHGRLDAWVYCIAPWARARVSQHPWSTEYYRNEAQRIRLTYRS